MGLLEWILLTIAGCLLTDIYGNAKASLLKFVLSKKKKILSRGGDLPSAQYLSGLIDLILFTRVKAALYKKTQILDI